MKSSWPWVWVGVVAVGMLAFLAMPAAPAGPQLFLPLHAALAALAAFMGFAVFAITRHGSHDVGELDYRLVGPLFLGVVLFDLIHAMSYPGLPDLIVPNSLANAKASGLAARLLAALALLSVPAARLMKKRRPWHAGIGAAGAFALAAGAAYLAMPVDAAAVPGLLWTLDFIVVLICFAAVFLLWRRTAAMSSAEGRWLIAAALAIGTSDLAALATVETLDLRDVLRHGLAFVGYWMLYRAVFVGLVHGPQERLHESERQLKEREAELRTFINANTEDGMVFWGPAGELRMATFLPTREMTEIGVEVARTRAPRSTEGADAERWFDLHYYPAFTTSGDLLGVCLYARDTTARRRQEQELRKLSMAVEQSPVTVVITDAAGAIEYVNDAFCRISGYSRGEALGQNPRVLKSGLVSDETYVELWGTITSGRVWQGELCNRKKNGEIYWEYAIISPIRSPQGEISHFIAVKENITQRREFEAKLVHQANHDQLTGLPNRVLAMDRLAHSVSAASRMKKGLAVMFVNLDGLNRVNDSLGHRAGDEVLREIARRLVGVMGEGRTVARMEGDEFLVVQGGLDAIAVAEVSARRILEECRRPMMVQGQQVFLTARIGMSVYPVDSDDPWILIRNAHAAAVRAKERGGNMYRFFTPQMDEDATARLNIESRLQGALENGEFRVYYQPLIEAQSGAIIGAEALLRWFNDELGSVPPDQFIPLAEAGHIIIPLSRWVLSQACHQTAQWRHLGGTSFFCAVNFSPRQFEQLDLAEQVEKTLAEAKLPAHCLEIEVTERLLLGSVSSAKLLLDEMRDMGAKLSIDDFGTGYSAMGYLKQYSFDTLKIDRSFTKDLSARQDVELVKAIVDMAHALRMKVIAEGVEDAEQEAILKGIGCEMLQGYYYGRPMPAEDFTRMLEQHGRQMAVKATLS